MRRATPTEDPDSPEHRSGEVVVFPVGLSARADAASASHTPATPARDAPYDVRLRVRPGLSQGAPASQGAVASSWSAAPPDEGLLHQLPGALLFDPRFYAAQAGDVDWPRTHYMREGWKRGFDPHPLFCTDYYVQQLGRPVRRDPLFDFLTKGRFEGAQVHPLFCNVAYLARRSDVLNAGVHPLVHYIEYGWREGVRGPFRWFDEDAYERQVPGLAQAGIMPLAHYLAFGWREGKTPTAQFPTSLLLEVGAVDASRGDPLTRFLVDLEARVPPATAARPRTSIIILNLNKPLLTLACLRAVEANTDLAEVEVIVVDNGSTDVEFAKVAESAAGVRLIRLPANMGFGEANNIAVAAACGEEIVFLNNDAFVTPGWLPRLSQVLAQAGVGAVGPLLLYPDGTVQEAGASVGVDGIAHQFGKGLSPDFEPLTRQRDVDYVSAAALMVRKSLFEAVGGFDLCWDPAYYEDADLCLKIKLCGQRVVYTPETSIFHLEHATSSDLSLDLRLHDVVEINRLKFISRWSGWLQEPTRPPHELLAAPPRRPAQVDGSRPRAVLYTPFPLAPGGGERYLLTLADALAAGHEVVLATEAPYSDLRLRNLARDLGLDLGGVRLVSRADGEAAASADLLIAMSNEVLPPLAPRAKVNVHHCQFPFPMDAACVANRWAYASGWRATVVNSDFTRRAYLREAVRFGAPNGPVHVLHPPVPQIAGSAQPRDGVRRILNVGRFFRDGHCKRQDRLVTAFRDLVRRMPDQPVELHLAGAVGAAAHDREYLRHVRRLASGLPVRFHINIQPGELARLYAAADLYWHATGLGEDLTAHPERFEHFGITVVEAMSAGAVPLALDAAGPGEIIRHGQDGWLYRDEAELVQLSAAMLEEDPSLALAEMSACAAARAPAFAPERFREGVAALLASLAFPEG